MPSGNPFEVAVGIEAAGNPTSVQRRCGSLGPVPSILIGATPLADGMIATPPSLRQAQRQQMYVLRIWET